MLRTLLRQSLGGDVRCVQTFLHRRQLATRMPGMHFGLTATEDRYGGVTANLGELSEAISDAGFGAILAGTVNPFYTDIRYNSKIRYNVNLVCTKISGSCIFSLIFSFNSSGKHVLCIC